MRARSRAVLLASVVIGSALHVGVGEGVVRFDFETGDLQGWRLVEGEFGKLVCEPRKVRGNEGKLLLTTLQREDERNQSDRMTGIVESPVRGGAYSLFFLTSASGVPPDSFERS